MHHASSHLRLPPAPEPETPEEVEEKMQPVKHLLEYSTQLATRYQFGGRIPWSRFIQRKVDRKRSARERRKAAKEREKQGLPPLPTRPVKLGVAGKLKKARTEDIQRRAALEPPVPPRVKTEEQLEKEAKKKAKAEKKRVKAEKKARAIMDQLVAERDDEVVFGDLAIRLVNREKFWKAYEDWVIKARRARVTATWRHGMVTDVAGQPASGAPLARTCAR